MEGKSHISSIALLAGLWCSSAPAATRLNNFVVEHVNAAPAAGTHAFTLDRDEWVFIRLTGTGKATLDRAASPIPMHPGPAGETQEAMRRLPGGRHEILITGEKARRCEVRRVPEIIFNKFQYDPWMIPEGPFDWEFLKSCILPHVNTICGMRGQDQARWSVPWVAAGGRWIVETMAPGLSLRAESQGKLTPEQVASALEAQADLKSTSLDGMLIDEYYPSLSKLFPATTAAVRLLHANAGYAGKRVDLYVAGDPTEMKSFIADGVKAGARLAFEAYNCEQPTEAQATQHLKKHLTDRMQEFARIIPDAPRHMIVCPGMYDAPPESLNTQPQVNYRVFQDMEFHLMANDPAFEGLFGVMAYTCGYSEADTVRWLGRLYRHYCIEGRTTRLSDEPYLLTHVINGDFEQNLTGWTVEPAQQGSVEIRHVPNLGSLAARLGSGSAGDHCIVMRRHNDKPNIVRQRIKHLKSGATYTLRLIGTNLDHRDSSYGNPTSDDVNVIWPRLTGADVLPDRSYRQTYRSIHTSRLMYFNYHVVRFRATAETAELVVSDWESPARRVGAAGREAAFNFVEVQACLP